MCACTGAVELCASKLRKLISGTDTVVAQAAAEASCCAEEPPAESEPVHGKKEREASKTTSPASPLDAPDRVKQPSEASSEAALTELKVATFSQLHTLLETSSATFCDKHLSMAALVAHLLAHASLDSCHPHPMMSSEMMQNSVLGFLALEWVMSWFVIHRLPYLHQ